MKCLSVSAPPPHYNFLESEQSLIPLSVASRSMIPVETQAISMTDVETKDRVFGTTVSIPASRTSASSHAEPRRISSQLMLSLFVATLLSMMLQQPSWATNPPAFSVLTGVFSRPTQTQLSMTAEPGAEIRFTTDGSEPNPTTSPIYSSPIALGPKNVIKAIAVLSSVPSTVTTAFIQNDPSAQPVPRSGLQLWLKDFGSLTSGSNVTEWVDLSGSSNNAVQATAASQPTYVSSGINDFPSVSFDGTNDSLSLSSGLGPNLTTGASGPVATTLY